VKDLNKGIRKAEVSLKWDPSPAGQPPTDLDIVAATYSATDPYGDPAYGGNHGEGGWQRIDFPSPLFPPAREPR
jgi:hypothetical protein